MSTPPSPTAPASGEPADPPSRRDAVRLAVAASLAAASLAGCAGRGEPRGSYTSVPAATPDDDGSRVLAPLDALPVHAAMVVGLDGEAYALTRPREETVKVFDATCPHQDCIVVVSRGLLHCPCHDSDFDPETGARLRGPAPAGLTEVAAEVSQSKIGLVDE